MPLARTTASLTALALLAVPAVASAKGAPDHAGHGHAKHERTAAAHGVHGHGAHAVTYVLRGTWSAGAVQVQAGNAHARRAGMVGRSVALDLTGAKLRVDDVDGNGTRDAADVRDGDRVLVQLRLPRGAAGEAPYAVRKLVDRTHATEAQAGDVAGTGDDTEAPASGA